MPEPRKEPEASDFTAALAAHNAPHPTDGWNARERNSRKPQAGSARLDPVSTVPLHKASWGRSQPPAAGTSGCHGHQPPPGGTRAQLSAKDGSPRAAPVPGSPRCFPRGPPAPFSALSARPSIFVTFKRTYNSGKWIQSLSCFSADFTKILRPSQKPEGLQSPDL